MKKMETWSPFPNSPHSFNAQILLFILSIVSIHHIKNIISSRRRRKMAEFRSHFSVILIYFPYLNIPLQPWVRQQQNASHVRTSTYGSKNHLLCLSQEQQQQTRWVSRRIRLLVLQLLDNERQSHADIISTSHHLLTLPPTDNYLFTLIIKLTNLAIILWWQLLRLRRR